MQIFWRFQILLKVSLPHVEHTQSPRQPVGYRSFFLAPSPALTFCLCISWKMNSLECWINECFCIGNGLRLIFEMGASVHVCKRRKEYNYKSGHHLFSIFTCVKVMTFWNYLLTQMMLDLYNLGLERGRSDCVSVVCGILYEWSGLQHVACLYLGQLSAVGT